MLGFLGCKNGQKLSFKAKYWLKIKENCIIVLDNSKDNFSAMFYPLPRLMQIPHLAVDNPFLIIYVLNG